MWKMTDGVAHNAIKRLLPGILWFVVVASPQALTAAADAELPCKVAFSETSVIPFKLTDCQSVAPLDTPCIIKEEGKQERGSMPGPEFPREKNTAHC